MSSALSAWSGGACAPTGRASGRCICAIALALAAIGVGGSAFLADPVLKMLALTVGAFGVFASLPIFWTLPTAFLAGAAVAPGIAAINSIGNLSGYFGPFAMGWIKDATGSFAWGLLTIAGCASSPWRSRWRSATTRNWSARPRRRNDEEEDHPC